MLKVYIAGPDVFEPNALEVGQRLKAIAREHGLEPLFPFDNEVDIEKSANPSLEIFLGNRDLIDAADMVVANLNPFRGGIEPDSGTVWEIGYAIGRGKPVVGYLASTESMQERILRVEGRPGEIAATTDREGRTIEPFGHALNLMLVHSVELVFGDFRDACRRAIDVPVRNCVASGPSQSVE